MILLPKILNLLLLLSLIIGCVTTPSINVNLKIASQINTQLGLEYLKRKQMDLAKQKLLFAIKLDPYSAEVQEAMGYFFLTTGEIKTAQFFYDKALRNGKQNGTIQNNYGIFLCKTGRYKEAIQHFLIAASNFNYLNTSLAYQNASFCAAQIPDFELASLYANKAKNYIKN